MVCALVYSVRVSWFESHLSCSFVFLLFFFLRFINHKPSARNELKEVVSSVSWDVVDFDADDIELPWSQWKDLFFSAVNYVVPRVKWSRRKMKHWFSESTIN